MTLAIGTAVGIFFSVSLGTLAAMTGVGGVGFAIDDCGDAGTVVRGEKDRPRDRPRDSEGGAKLFLLLPQPKGEQGVASWRSTDDESSRGIMIRFCDSGRRCTDATGNADEPQLKAEKDAVRCIADASSRRLRIGEEDVATRTGEAAMPCATQNDDVARIGEAILCPYDSGEATGTGVAVMETDLCREGPRCLLPDIGASLDRPSGERVRMFPPA